jgi:hypothetical protein
MAWHGIWLIPLFLAALAGDSVPKPGTVRIAPLPHCETEPLKSSQTYEIASRPMIVVPWSDTRSLRLPPFKPLLAATDDGRVHLLLSLGSDCLLGDRVPGGIETFTWDGDSWSAPETIAGGDALCRDRPAAVPLEQGNWAVAWREHSKTAWRTVARVKMNGVWSDPLAVFNHTHGELGLARGPDGRAHLFWIDSGERHRVLSLYHPVIFPPKLFHQVLGDPGQTPTDQVTAPGNYQVISALPVRALQPQQLEAVYFRVSLAESIDALAEGSRDLYLTAFTGKRWKAGKPLLVPAAGWRRELVQLVGAFRDARGALLVPFVGGSDLRILRREPGRPGRIGTLAGGLLADYGLRKVAAAMDREGALSIVYAPLSEQLVEHPLGDKPAYPERGWRTVPEPRPHYLVRTDGNSCLSSAVVSAGSTGSTPSPLFDVAVDSSGRTHVVWVEAEGDGAALRHRWFTPGKKATR